MIDGDRSRERNDVAVGSPALPVEVRPGVPADATDQGKRFLARGTGVLASYDPEHLPGRPYRVDYPDGAYLWCAKVGAP